VLQTFLPPQKEKIRKLRWATKNQSGHLCKYETKIANVAGEEGALARRKLTTRRERRRQPRSGATAEKGMAVIGHLRGSKGEEKKPSLSRRG